MSNSSSLWSDAFRRLIKNKAAVGGAIVLLILFILAALAPWIAPYPYAYQNLDLGASPPSAEHLLGTDILDEIYIQEFFTAQEYLYLSGL